MNKKKTAFPGDPPQPPTEAPSGPFFFISRKRFQKKPDIS